MKLPGDRCRIPPRAAGHVLAPPGVGGEDQGDVPEVALGGPFVVGFRGGVVHDLKEDVEHVRMRPSRFLRRAGAPRCGCLADGVGEQAPPDSKPDVSRRAPPIRRLTVCFSMYSGHVRSGSAGTPNDAGELLGQLGSSPTPRGPPGEEEAADGPWWGEPRPGTGGEGWRWPEPRWPGSCPVRRTFFNSGARLFQRRLVVAGDAARRESARSSATTCSNLRATPITTGTRSRSPRLHPLQGRPASSITSMGLVGQVAGRPGAWKERSTACPRAPALAVG